MHAGKLIGDFTVAKAAPTNASTSSARAPPKTITCAGWETHLPADGSVALRPLTAELTGLSIAGPSSRELLPEPDATTDVSNAAMPFMAFREMDLGLVPAKVGRVTFTGDLGYEIWVPVRLSARPS